MKSLNSMFISVYKGLLEPYGYKQIKKTPYFVNVVGNEIIKIITCIPRQSDSKTIGRFTIVGKIMTIYNLSLDFNKSPNSQNWMTISDYYVRNSTDFSKGFEETVKVMRPFCYEKNDVAFEKKILESAEMTQKTLLKYFAPVNDLSSYISFCDKYCMRVIVRADDVGSDMDLGDMGLCFMTENMDDYYLRNEMWMKNNIERFKKMLEAGCEGINKDTVERKIEKYEIQKQQRYKDCKKLFSDPIWIEKVCNRYMEKRKENIIYLQNEGIL